MPPASSSRLILEVLLHGQKIAGMAEWLKTAD
jgi:hypothetical protein